MTTPTSSTVMISNGEEFFKIPVDDLAAARAEGFYLPVEKGMAIVSNGTDIFEIPIADVAAAVQDGFRDLIPEGASKNRNGTRLKRQPRRFGGLPVPTMAAVAAVRLETGKAEAAAELSRIRIDSGIDPTERVTDRVEIESVEKQPEARSPSQVEVEDEPDEELELRQELEEQYEQAEGWEKFRLWLRLNSPAVQDLQRFSRSYGVSTGLHLLLLIVLSFIIFQSKDKQDGGAVISSRVGHEDTIAEDEPEEVLIEEAEDAADAQAAAATGSIADTIGAASNLTSAVGPEALTGGLNGLADALEGLDRMSGTGEKITASFFGSKTTASSFVFCIDNSNSMTRGKFETALDQLAKTITKLGPQQRYFIVFYSDTAYPLFWPRAVDDLIPATNRNKQLTLNWLSSVELCLRTDGREAMEMAIALAPDVIYILGDGAFTDGAAAFMAAQDLGDTVVHTLGMEVREQDAAQFESIAKAHDGIYNDVGIDPRGAEMAKRTPRKRNNKRGPVWGVWLK